MALLDELKQAVTDPNFQAITDPAQKLEAWQAYLAAKSPEFAAISEPGVRAQAAAEALTLADPQATWGDTLKTAGTVAAGFIPFAGPALQTAITGQARPWTKALLPEDANLEDQVLGELARGVAEDALMFGPLLRFGKWVSGAGRVSGKMAASSSRIQQGLAPVIENAIGLGTTGALFGVLDNIEHEEFNPGTILLSGGMGALVGAVIGVPAARAAFMRNPSLMDNVKLAAAENPRIKETLDGVAEQHNLLVKATETHLKMPEPEARTFIARAVSEDLSPGEFHSLRQVMGKDPDFLKTDLGLAILQRQRNHLLPKVFESDVDLQIRVEDAQGRATTYHPMKRAEVRDLLRKHEDGQVYITEVVGRPRDVSPLRAQLGINHEPGVPRVVEGQLQPDISTGAFARNEGPIALPSAAQRVDFQPTQDLSRLPQENQVLRGESPRALPAPEPLQTSREVSGLPPQGGTPDRLTTGRLDPLTGPLPTQIEAGLSRYALDAPMSPIESKIRAYTGGPLAHIVDAEFTVRDFVQPPTPRALMPGLEAPAPRQLTGSTPRGFLPEMMSKSPGSTVKVLETGQPAIVSKVDGPLVYVRTPAGEVPAIPMADGTVRISQPTAPVQAAGTRARPVARLSDDELISGSALLARKALEASGKERASAIESRGRYLEEIERRIGSKPLVQPEGTIASHLKDCL